MSIQLGNRQQKTKSGSILTSVSIADDIEALQTDHTVNLTIIVNDKPYEYKLTLEQCRQVTDRLQQMEQITYEERLIDAQLNFIDSEKRRIQTLLNQLRTTDSYYHS